MVSLSSSLFGSFKDFQVENVLFRGARVSVFAAQWENNQ